MSITLTEEQLERVLIGSEVSVSVAEPWELARTLGSRAGRIVAVDHGDAGGEKDLRSQTVRIAVTPFDIQGRHYRYQVEYLTAHRRYADDRGLIEQLASGGDVDVNLGYEDQAPAEALPDGVSPFLIGGVILSEWKSR